MLSAANGSKELKLANVVADTKKLIHREQTLENCPFTKCFSASHRIIRDIRTQLICIYVSNRIYKSVVIQP